MPGEHPIMKGVRHGVRDLDHKFAQIRSRSGFVGVNGYTIVNAMLGDEGAGRRIRQAIQQLPSRVNLKAVEPLRPSVILNSLRGDAAAERAMRNGARKLVVWVGTRPKLARRVPGVP